MSGHESFHLGRYRFKTFVVQVGPVPVVITPVAEAEVLVSYAAQAQASLNFNQAAHARFGVEYESGAGFEPIKDVEATEPTLEPLIDQVQFGAELELDAEIDLEFYGGVGEAGLGFAAGATAGYTYPNCFIDIDAYLDAHGAADLELPLFDDLEWSDSLRIKDWDLPDLRVPGAPGCPWTGVIEVTSSWNGSAIYDPAGDLFDMTNRRGGATSLSLRRVVPDGDVNGYWVNTGSINGTSYPDCGDPPGTSTFTGTLAPQDTPDNEHRDQWRLSDLPPTAYPGSGSRTSCGETIGYPVDLQIDTGAYFALHDVWSNLPPGVNTVDESWTYAVGPSCPLPDGGRHWCHGADYPENTADVRYEGGGAITIHVRMTRLRDVNSNGVPD
jgi:hypothetical protein